MNKLSTYYYNKLPKVYRDMDRELQLKRYLETLVEVGLGKVLEETKKIEDLVDPDKCPNKYLPYLCATYGIVYKHDIPELFQRRFLKNCVSLYQRKGTKTAIEFLARELSGFMAQVRVEDREDLPKLCVVTLNAFEEDEKQLLVAQDVIDRYVREFIPVGLDALIVVSYGFTDEKELSLEEANDVIGIIDRIFVEWENSIVQEEKIKLVLNVDSDGEDYSDIRVVREMSSVSNIGIVGVTLMSNIISVVDIVNGEKRFY